MFRFKLIRKKRFPTTIFVMTALIALLSVINIAIIISITSTTGRDGYQKGILGNHIKNKYFFKDDFDTDPYITKRPNLENILAGPIVSSVDPSMGEEDAPVVIVQYSDFECKSCQKQESVIDKILAAYSDKVKLVWKDFPETNINSASYQAAIAARCAQTQDRFWEYHDSLYDAGSLDQITFLTIADNLGLNIGQFKSCLDSGQVNNLINDDILEATALEINGVPFIYVNRQEVLGEIGLEDLNNLVQIELNKNN